MRIIINALIAKKNSGGGFQIAYNFINKANSDKSVDWYFFVSQDIDDIIGSTFSNIKNERYFVFPTQPNKKTHHAVQKIINKIISNVKPDVLYSILAPSYFKFNCVQVMRCTNPWVNYSHFPKYILRDLSLKTKIRLALTAFISHYQMKKNNFFITQTHAAAEGINQITHIGTHNIKVIPNVLPATYNGYAVADHNRDFFNIVYVTAPHPHKNIEIIPKVAQILEKKYRINNFVFYITISKKNSSFINKLNFISKQYDVEGKIINVGYQTQEQLKNLYSKCNLYFFPSLLETFSVSLIEAMFFQMPIVATNLNFNREVTGNAALYFEPKNAEEAAKQIARIIKNNDIYDYLVLNGNEQLKKYNDYDKYFNETKLFLISAANITQK